MHTALLIVVGIICIEIGVGLLAGVHEARSWMRKRRARRIEEAFRSGSFTVPTSWVREARRHRSAAGR